MLTRFLFVLGLQITAICGPAWPQSSLPQNSTGTPDAQYIDTTDHVASPKTFDPTYSLRLIEQAIRDLARENNQTEIDLVPALNLIEDAIRDLVPVKDQVDEALRIEHATRDLNAQEKMAKWAELMYYATGATVVLTALALLTIAITLHYTRKAANASVDMVEEAATATRAAEETLRITHTIGREQIESANEANQLARNSIREQSRPFLYVEPNASNFADWLTGDRPLSWPVTIKNLGHSAAVITKVLIRATISEELDSNQNWSGEQAAKLNGMAPGVPEDLLLLPRQHFQPSTGSVLMRLREPEYAQVNSNQAFVFLKIRVEYSDMYGEPHETVATFQHGFHNYRVTTVGGKKHNYRT